MFIKELSKKSSIPIKDLLASPVGLLCYIRDCLKNGLYIDEIIDKIIAYNIPDNPMLDSINDKNIIGKIITDYELIDSVELIYNLC